MFIRRYLDAPANGPGVLCRVARETQGQKASEFHIVIRPRVVTALRLLSSSGRPVFLPWENGQARRMTPGKYTLDTCWSNGPSDKVLVMLDGRPLSWGDTFTIDFDDKKRLSLMQATTFQPLGIMDLNAASMASVTMPRSSF